MKAVHPPGGAGPVLMFAIESKSYRSAEIISNPRFMNAFGDVKM